MKVMLRRAVEHMVKDESFQVPVEPAAKALKVAKCVLAWASQEENKAAFSVFENKLVSELQTCFHEHFQSIRVQQMEMWHSYHQLRTSDHFRSAWHAFLSCVKCDPLPTFYQDATNLMFEELIQSQYPLDEGNDVFTTESITYEDANVICYGAGYVCRKVMKNKIEKSDLPNKLSLKKCLLGLLEDEGEFATTVSADWIDAVDRGGLWCVREGTYMLFSAMEEEVRSHFHTNKVQEMTKGYKETIISAIMDNDDVLFHWCMLTADTEDEDANTLLRMLVDLWITIRGFSFASSCLELYKREKKKGLQRSKALCKGIH